MSYQGGAEYLPINTVDQQAAVTGMMPGDASMANSNGGGTSAWGTPTKQMLLMWFGAIFLYWLIAFFFRRYLA